MISNFDLVKLRDLCKDLYRVTGLRITVFDDNYDELLSYPEPLPEFCAQIRTCHEGVHRCKCSDQQGCSIADQQGGVHIYTCHAGLTEVIASMKLGKINVGYLCFGHISPTKNKEEAWEIVEDRIKDLPLDMNKVKRAFVPSEYKDRAYLESAANVMDAVASYVCVTHLATLKKDDMPYQIDTYINNNLDGNLDSDSLCSHFGMSRAKLYQISMANFGMGITEYIRSLRVKKAQDLLIDSNDSISTVAEKVGIHDYNYFTKVFKREIGMTPSQYRKDNEGK